MTLADARSRCDVRADLFVRVSLVLHVLARYIRVRSALTRRSLPDTMSILTPHRPRSLGALTVRQLAHGVGRILGARGLRTRCINQALVLYSLAGTGSETHVVIGLDDGTGSATDAHAWVEVDGTDVGPPPGRGPHSELVRYR